MIQLGVAIRVFRPFEGVVPVTDKGDVLDAKAAANRGKSGLNGWMAAAERIWKQNAESGNMTLIERWNYHNELGTQFPIPKLRVIYAASGTLPAAIVMRQASVIEHGIYWAPVRTEAEGNFLAAILNSEAARARVASMQARGAWGARDFDKVMFNLPIPRFDEKQKVHRDLAAAAAEAEKIAASVALPENVKFQRARKLIRDALAEAGISQRIDKLVARLLDTAEGRGTKH